MSQSKFWCVGTVSRRPLTGADLRRRGKVVSMSPVMHELSVALSILEVAGEEAASRGAGRVAAVHLKVGPLAGVVPAALRSAWPLACDRTPLAGCRLVIEEAPVLARCDACRADRPVVSIQDLRCADCGTPASQLVGGRELEVTALEISE